MEFGHLEDMKPSRSLRDLRTYIHWEPILQAGTKLHQTNLDHKNLKHLDSGRGCCRLARCFAGGFFPGKNNKNRPQPIDPSFLERSWTHRCRVNQAPAVTWIFIPFFWRSSTGPLKSSPCFHHPKRSVTT